MPDPKPRTLVRFHFVAMIVWASLAIPTVLIWRESLLWVAFMSLYANFVGHFSGWDAARAEQIAEEAADEPTSPDRASPQSFAAR
jgi:uncharacterized membrane protein